MLMTWIAQKKQNRRGAYRRFVFTNNVAPKYNLLVLDLFKILQKKMARRFCNIPYAKSC